MIWLRTVRKTTLALALTFCCYAMVAASKLLQPISPRLRLRARNATFRIWGRGLCWIFGARIEVEGPPPQGSFFLVANHLGYLDIPLIATQVHAAFVAKSDLQSWPALGPIFGAADTIFIDRSRKRDIVRVMELLQREFDRGLGLLVFPEGTSGKGDEILKFRPSLLEFACDRKLPVHWVTLHYQTPDGELPAQRSICWWGDEGFVPHFRRLVAVPHFRAILRFGEAPIAHEDRKELAEQLHQAMSARFTPVAG